LYGPRLLFDATQVSTTQLLNISKNSIHTLPILHPGPRAREAVKHAHRRGVFTSRFPDVKVLPAKPAPATSINCQTGFGGVLAAATPPSTLAQIARRGHRPRGRRRDHAFAGANSRRAAPLRGRAPAPRAPRPPRRRAGHRATTGPRVGGAAPRPGARFCAPAGRAGAFA
jgi:hypothetical protein